MYSHDNMTKIIAAPLVPELWEHSVANQRTIPMNPRSTPPQWLPTLTRYQSGNEKRFGLFTVHGWRIIAGLQVIQFIITDASWGEKEVSKIKNSLLNNFYYNYEQNEFCDMKNAFMPLTIIFVGIPVVIIQIMTAQNSNYWRIFVASLEETMG